MMKTQARESDKLKDKIIFSCLVLLTTALMGSSFVVAKIGLIYISPLLLAGIRFTIAGSIMAAFVVIFKRKHPKDAKTWRNIVLIGAIQTAGVMGSIFLSLRTITSGQSAILTFMNPLLVVLIGTLLLGMHYRLIQWIGVFLGFAGVFVTMGSELELEIGTLLGFMSAIFWAGGTLLIKKWGVTIDMWVLTAYQMLFGGVILLTSSLFLENTYLMINSTSVFILFWLSIPASIVQFTIWFYLLQKGDSGKVSAFLFLAPFFGILSGWLVLGEPLGYALLLGGSLIFTGIFLVNWPEKRLPVKATI